jgi:hypothetical protein
MRLYSLGVKAIDSLMKEDKKVSYRSVAMKSKEIDPEGKGIHTNTIKVNEQLYLYYLQHSSVKVSIVEKRDRSQIVLDDTFFRNIKLGRDIDSVKKRYSKLSKRELIAHLINAEQYIAE